MSEPRVFEAPVQVDGPIPAYKIVELEGPFERTICHFDEKSKQIVRTPQTSDVGYMVFFPRGHSHMYHSKEALIRAGFGEVVPLIDLRYESEMNKELPTKAVRAPIQKGNE